jgi:hypothetical protein
MKEDDPVVQQKTSRRAFTRDVVTALATAPIAASMLSCTNRANQSGLPPNGPTPCTSPTPTVSPTPPTGPTKASCDFGLGAEDHIPPMELDGGGSLRIESRQRLDTANNQPPFVYAETGIQDPAQERMGNLHKVRVITDLAARPFVTDDLYFGLPPGCQLLLWYIKLKQIPPSPDPDEINYEDNPQYPPADPDVRVVGGAGGTNIFQMTIKSRKLRSDKSHKRHRPNRLVDDDPGGSRQHFRIGQWRIVDSNNATVTSGGTAFEDQGKENYHFYLTFDDFQP